MNICNKFERLQCNAVLGITGAITGSSIERLYQELGFSFSRSRRWLRNFAYFIKLLLISHQSIFIIMFQQLINPIKLEAVTNFYICLAEYNTLQTLSFVTKGRNGVINLRMEICKSISYEVFKNSVRKFVRRTPNSLFNISDRLTRLHVSLSHRKEHKFNFNFQDTINPICFFSVLPKLRGLS